MMTKSKSNGAARLKLLFALPVAAMMLAFTTLSGNIIAQEEESKVPPPPPKAERVATAADTDAPPAPPKAPQEKDKVYKEVEDMPEYPGGIKALYAFLGENINYPEIAKKQKVSAKVFVKYIVEKDGSITKAEIIGVKTGVDKEKYKEALNAMKKESMRVVYLMPKWKPGKVDGKPVRVEYALPIAYKLDGSKEEKPQ
jgi:protein TonB